MRTAIYIVKIIPENVVDNQTQATVYRHKTKSIAAFQSFSKLLFSGGLNADEVQLLKYTFMGSPQTVVAKALEIGSVLSRGEYITADPFCDGEWDVELMKTTGSEVASA
jgi:hypothetical protein